MTGFAGTKDTLFTGSFDGTLNTFDVSSGTCTPVQGSSSHSGGPIVAMTSAGPSTVLSAAMDGMVKEMDASAKSFKPSSAAATGLPKSIAADANGKSYIVTEKSVEVVSSGAKSSSIPLDFTPSSGAAYSTTKALLAVGGEDGKVRIYANGSLTKTLESNRSAVSALSFSPDGAYLAAGESNGKIVLFNTGDWSVKTTQWAFHSARITCLAWSEDSQFCASGSLDTALYVWSVARPVKKVAIKVRRSLAKLEQGGLTDIAVGDTERSLWRCHRCLLDRSRRDCEHRIRCDGAHVQDCLAGIEERGTPRDGQYNTDYDYLRLTPPDRLFCLAL